MKTILLIYWKHFMKSHIKVMNYFTFKTNSFQNVIGWRGIFMLTDMEHFGNKIENLTKKRIIDNKEYLTFKDIQTNMYDILIEKATTTPNKIGVVDSFYNNYSYKELLELTDDFTAYLYKEKGITKGSHIGL